MNFKDRFKGRITTMKKEGFIETFAESNNPVQKSFSNVQINSLSKGTPSNVRDFQMMDMSDAKQSMGNFLENKPLMSGYSPSTQSKNSISNSEAHKSQLSHKQNKLANVHGVKNPFLVSNPFPSLDILESQMNYKSNLGSQALLDPTKQGNVYQSMPVNEFNPNSFYNQHSQFKSNMIGLNKSFQDQGSFIPTINQIHKKNFENLSQQNKQMRMAEEAMRGFENYNMLNQNQMPNNRYGGYEQFPTKYNYSPVQPMQGLNSYNREIHSNPVPLHHSPPNGFGLLPGNMTHQIERGRNYSNYPGGDIEIANLESQSKTSYKPYSLKDYKHISTKSPVKLGGLGPNTNTDQWQKEKEKRDKMIEFSHNVKLFNSLKASDTENSPKKRERAKEKSKREIALEFAKSVPKPRQRRNSSPHDSSTNIIDKKETTENEHVPKYYYKEVVRETNYELEEYEKRHMQYVNQLEKMKMA